MASFGATSASAASGTLPGRVRPFAAALLLCAAALPAAAQATEAIALPSGRDVTFLDSVWGEPGPAGLTLRFRFLEPDLSEALETLDYATAETDMRFLCESYALVRISNIGPQPSQVIVSIADRPSEFGSADPEVHQVFEAYRPDGAQCLWEGF